MISQILALSCCLEDIDSVNTEQILYDKLQYVISWLSANIMTLNANKSKYMLFGKHNKYTLTRTKITNQQ